MNLILAFCAAAFAHGIWLFRRAGASVHNKRRAKVS
jgi:hypothetical protein